MVLKISAPCVSDGSGNPFFFVGTCLWGVQDLAMERKKIATDSAVFCVGISFGKKHAQNIILLLNQLHIFLLNRQS